MSYVNSVVQERSISVDHLLTCEWSELAPGRGTAGTDPVVSFLTTYPGLSSIQNVCEVMAEKESAGLGTLCAVGACRVCGWRRCVAGLFIAFSWIWQSHCMCGGARRCRRLPR